MWLFVDDLTYMDYGSIVLRAYLIKIREFVPKTSWIALRQRQFLHFFIGNQNRTSALKVRAQSCLTVAQQLFD